MKIYKREGRRFVEIQDVTGMHLQKDGTFSKERNDNSIGICVLQTTTIRKIVLFKTGSENWNEYKKFCESLNAHLPNLAEMYIALDFIKLDSGYTYTDGKGSTNTVFFFLDIYI